MSRVRLGAVSYLNTKPLVYGLDQRADLFDVRFDVPAQCATLLHDGLVDIGLIPAIEYQRGEYQIVPGVAIGSDGPIDSVALFSRVPLTGIRTLALDISSRTSVALTRILCARHWGIAPRFTPAEPRLDAMLDRADAALVIGDNALWLDPAAHGVTKVDLGAAWREMTGLPFVYAVWTGRAGAATPDHVAALQAARDAGLGAIDAIAREASGGDAARTPRIAAYLRDNLKYALGEAEVEGLRRFHALAAEHGLIPGLRPLRFYA
ncbi:MAG: menaquinone biosynthetic enzyme MqnA/MqnD family protein [Vicinamibacterales bacterium]